MTEQNSNPYTDFEGKNVRVTFSDFGQSSIVEGVLTCEDYQHTIFVNNWSVGVANVQNIVEIPNFPLLV